LGSSQQSNLAELGLLRLGQSTAIAREQCIAFLRTAPTDNALDIIEYSFRLMLDWRLGETTEDADDDAAEKAEESEEDEDDGRMSATEAVEELNYRLRENGVGYQFENGYILRADSAYVHQEVVKPTIQLLSETGFEGPNQEFMRAHEHYRHGRNKEAIADALKAFESTMKAICGRRSWGYPPGATASRLTEVVLANGLIPPYLTQHFSALKSTLDAGLPTLRNRRGGHGQGAQPVEVPDYLAAYALHLAGTNIELLVEADKALP
jgi:hypothetical protein